MKTETTDGINIEGNQLSIDCIISNQDNFHLDKEGNLTVNSIVAKENVKTDVNLDTMYPIGSTYMNASDVNPSTLFGGTWELERTFFGGELLAFGTAVNGSRNEDEIVKNLTTPFSDYRIPNKKYNFTNYVDGILSSGRGTIVIKPQGIVGLVEAQIYLSGLGANGTKGFWWCGNYNELPTGVTLLPHDGANGLLTGPIDTNYGGNSNTYFYKVDDTADFNTSFYINPSFQSYGGDFTPCSSTTKCYLMVKAYAKTGTSYMWKRIS